MLLSLLPVSGQVKNEGRRPPPRPQRASGAGTAALLSFVRYFSNQAIR